MVEGSFLQPFLCLMVKSLSSGIPERFHVAVET